jgi:hypothetical protein
MVLSNLSRKPHKVVMKWNMQGAAKPSCRNMSRESVLPLVDIGYASEHARTVADDLRSLLAASLISTFVEDLSLKAGDAAWDGAERTQLAPVSECSLSSRVTSVPQLAFECLSKLHHNATVRSLLHNKFAITMFRDSWLIGVACDMQLS